MARSLDFGESAESVGQLAKGPSALGDCITMLRHYAGKQISTHVLPTAVAAFGRSSEREVCLRVEPTDLPANREKTFHISINHCLLRYIGDRVEIIDTHSTNGTSLKSVGRLQPGLAVPVSDGEVIALADALTLQVEFCRRSKPLPPDDSMVAQLDVKKDDAQWLNDHLIGREKPGILDYVRLAASTIFPRRSTSCFSGSAISGTLAHALIRLDPDAATQPHVRTLDLGDGVPDDPAGLYWAGNALHVQCNVADQVRINGTAISAGEDRVLSGGETIEVLGQTIQVVAKP